MNLRTLFPFTVAAMAFLAVGCSSSHQPLTLPEIGPASATSAEPAAGMGTLVVFSAYEVGIPPPDARAYNQRHTDYTIVNADGSNARSVMNQQGVYRGDPAKVILPPGKYRVTARANGFGQVTIPVLIAADRTTAIHLEGGSPEGKPNGSPEQLVTLPDGTVVGWRAN
jgi:hypothetical protein